MPSKFSISDILRDELHTLRDFSSGKVSKTDIFLNLVLPGILSLSFVWFNRMISGGMINSILTAFSVFAALLLNLMLLVYTIVTRENSKSENSAKDELKLMLLKETYTNIQFAVLMSVFIIICLLLILFLPTNAYIENLFSLLIYYFIFVFIFTILMVLKRTHIIMKREISP
jgi:amino acid permease